jgi:hypothetical protein
MKKIMVLLTAIAVMGCGNTAVVLSSDGTKQLPTCDPGEWIKCIHEACPNGYDIVTIPLGHDGTGLVKCKP